MPPFLPSHDQADVGLANPELGGDFALPPLSGGMERSDLDDVTLGELGPMMLNAAYPKSLGDSILRVFAPIAQKIMGRILTRRIVAFMAHKEQTGIHPVSQEIGDAMGRNFPMVLSVPDSKLPISILVHAALPEPTIFRSTPSHMRPKSFDVLWGKNGQCSRLSISHVFSFQEHVGQSRAMLVASLRLVPIV